MSSEHQEAVTEPPSRAAEWIAVLANPLFWALALAAFFDGASDNWVHAVLLTSVAVVVARDAMLGSRGVEPPPSVAALREAGRRRTTALFAVCALGYAVVAGSWTRYTWPDTLAILLPGVTALLIGWQGTLWPRSSPTGRVDPRPWLVVLVALALWELAALLSQPDWHTDSAQHPTISVLVGPLLSSHAGRSIALLAWLVTGWYLLGRAPAQDAPEEQR